MTSRQEHLNGHPPGACVKVLIKMILYIDIHQIPVQCAQPTWSKLSLSDLEFAWSHDDKSQKMFGLFLAYTSTIFLLNIMLLAMIKHVLIMQIMMTINNFLVYSFA